MDNSTTITAASDEYSELGKALKSSSSKTSKRMMKAYGIDVANMNAPVMLLEPLNDTFASKRLDLISVIKVGRQVSQKLPPAVENGIFDSKVLSRQHAEIFSENGKAYIKDMASSNGTFVNGIRLSAEGVESVAHELKSGDLLEFGVDILNEDNVTVLYKKVACRITMVNEKENQGDQSALLSILQSQVEKATAQKNDLDQANVKLASVNQSLESKVKSGDLIPASQEIVQIRQELAAKNAEVQRLHKLNDDGLGEILKLQKIIAERESQLHKLSESTEADSKSMTARLQKAESAAASHEATVRTLNQELETLAQKLQKADAADKASRQQHSQHINSLTKQHETEVSALRRQLDQSISQEVMERRVKEAVSTANASNKLALDKTAADHQRALEDLKKQLAAAKQEKSSSADHKKAINELEKKHADAVKVLEAKVATAEQARIKAVDETTSAAAKERQQLERQLEAAVSSARQALTEKHEQTVVALKTELTDAHSLIDSLRSELLQQQKRPVESLSASGASAVVSPPATRSFSVLPTVFLVLLQFFVAVAVGLFFYAHNNNLDPYELFSTLVNTVKARYLMEN